MSDAVQEVRERLKASYEADDLWAEDYDDVLTLLAHIDNLKREVQSLGAHLSYMATELRIQKDRERLRDRDTYTLEAEKQRLREALRQVLDIASPSMKVEKSETGWLRMSDIRFIVHEALEADDE